MEDTRKMEPLEQELTDQQTQTEQEVDILLDDGMLSEIIAEVWRVMEESGKSEGILFLDEINCVSETLAPVMLQLLQYLLQLYQHFVQLIFCSNFL